VRHITPAAAAQLLTVRFTRVMLLAAVIGIASAVVGLYLSYWLDVASGATIVLVQTGAFLVALLLGPRGPLARRRHRLDPVMADDILTVGGTTA